MEQIDEKYTFDSTTDTPPLYTERNEEYSSNKAAIFSQKIGSNNKSLFAIDFPPQCLETGHSTRRILPNYQSFNELVKAANQWLSANRQYELQRCETVVRIIDSSGRWEMSKSVQHEASFGLRMRVQCLRVWFCVADSSRKAAPQQIQYFQVMPRLVKWKKLKLFAYGNTLISTAIKYPKFDDLEHTVALANEQLSSNIQGRIIHVDHLPMVVDSAHESGYDMNKTLLCESADKMTAFVYFMRIFYIADTPPREQKLHVRVFSPTIAEGYHGLIVDKFPAVLKRCSDWLAENQIQPISVQNVVCLESPENGRRFRFGMNFRNTNNRILGIFSDPLGCHLLNPMSQMNMRPSDGCYEAFTTLRVTYVECTDPAALLAPPPRSSTDGLKCRLFLPVKVGQRTYHNVEQTLTLLHSWVASAGCQVVCVETVDIRHRPQVNRVDDDQLHHELLYGASNSYLTGFRVYFYGDDLDPPPPYETLKASGTKQSKSCTCVIT